MCLSHQHCMKPLKPACRDQGLAASAAHFSARWPVRQHWYRRCISPEPKKATLCVAAPAARVAYIWNQWLKMSSMSSARKQKYHCLFRMPSTARRPAVESLHWAEAVSSWSPEYGSLVSRARKRPFGDNWPCCAAQKVLPLSGLGRQSGTPSLKLRVPILY